MNLPFTSIVRELPATVPFIPVEALERQSGKKIHTRIGANESSFGVSPLAKKAMEEALQTIHWYGDSECYDLRKELSRVHGVRMDEISAGSGIDECLGLVVRAFLEPGEVVVTSLGAYPTFNYHVSGFGAKLVTVPYRDYMNDLDALADKAREADAKMVYLANPDNPTGTFHSAGALHGFLEKLPEDCLLLLDEAYIEFAPAHEVLPLNPQNPRVIRTRTFSKVYGMAGARVGYVLAAKETVQAIDKIRNHFGVNRVAQAGAVASLKDPDFVRQVVRDVEEGKKEYQELAQKLGFSSLPSYTNFVAIDVGSEEKAVAIREALFEKGVFIRTPQVFPLSRCLRVTVGTPEERQIFAQALEEVVKEMSITGDTTRR
ncbi:aminotransferase class I/II-fold pyridoxal phosphate-dependent enzyme [Paenactinomyces guangxiensis]|uniref:Aminotransferase class I/II-fold pyridoxal phosphate-dependent enzyme n=2 Tax=Paenactinomyces guangxiensis TaxID=1490290 RepID=A0A7W1WNX8_9BACL|nr:aminotransferase class I/II-fold pyridoxal phosphate-dependent enzyme [Paenactinomyces guangxiensis]MBA4493388.1 aminotransferase class I/II-fold pyridoxal phosphate-dependent enzyme [Paenactinomyces guangxiensis]MBH8590478.1 aminotransferase class I/II-fold pyridoxal phosphate-dependent enzyme [Paenactinomyces guangxiensis]